MGLTTTTTISRLCLLPTFAPNNVLNATFYVEGGSYTYCCLFFVAAHGGVLLRQLNPLNRARERIKPLLHPPLYQYSASFYPQSRQDFTESTQKTANTAHDCSLLLRHLDTLKSLFIYFFKGDLLPRVLLPVWCSQQADCASASELWQAGVDFRRCRCQLLRWFPCLWGSDGWATA